MSMSMDIAKNDYVILHSASCNFGPGRVTYVEVDNVQVNWTGRNRHGCTTELKTALLRINTFRIGDRVRFKANDAAVGTSTVTNIAYDSIHGIDLVKLSAGDCWYAADRLELVMPPVQPGQYVRLLAKAIHCTKYVFKREWIYRVEEVRDNGKVVKLVGYPEYGFGSDMLEIVDASTLTAMQRLLANVERSGKLGPMLDAAWDEYNALTKAW
jgi:hypothetical protein